MNKLSQILSTALLLSAGFFLYAQEGTPDYLQEFLDTMEQAPAEVPLENQQELNVIFTETKLNLDPFTSAYTGEAQILNSTSEGLFTYNAATAEPDFALAVDYRTSRDQLYWTFTLRSDAKFSDGRSITSRDIKDSWLKLLSTPDAYYASFLDVIKGAKEFRTGKGSADEVAIFVKDSHTLSIQLLTPESHLPKILCHHAFSAVDLENGCSSGAYTVKSMSDTKLRLEKNKYYYNADNVLIPAINIFFSENEEWNTFMFNMGQVQWVDSACDVKHILDKDALKFEPLFGTYFFFFKTGNNALLTEDVRKALMDATPWETLRYGSLFPATTLVYPIHGYSQPAPLVYTDFDHAKVLMKEAKEKAGLSETDIIELTFEVPEGDSIYEAATVLKNSWARVGVKLNIRVNKDPSYYANFSKSKADLMLYTWIGDFSDPLAFLELFRGDSTLNDSHWKNEEFDSLIAQANETLDQNKRMSLLSQAEDILLSSGVVLPITHSIDMNIVNTNDIGGWTENPLNIHPFKCMYFKKSKSMFRHGNLVMR